MTVLAITPEYLVEHDRAGGKQILTIARRSDGMAITVSGRGIAGDFRSCVRTHGAERATATYLRIAASLKAPWHQVYRPGALVDLSDWES